MNILAVGAHWDDIEIGCGLTLMRLRERGAVIFGAVLTESDYEVVEDNHIRQVGHAREEGMQAFKAMGIIHKPSTPLPNQRMVYDQGVMQELEAIVREESVDMVFTHQPGDHNTDHKATWDISRTAFRNVGSILTYQSNTYFDNVTNFNPQFFWGFSKEEYERKKAVIALHRTEWEYRRERWQREIFDRERFWGHLCGCDYAEAFGVVRLLDSGPVGVS